MTGRIHISDLITERIARASANAAPFTPAGTTMHASITTSPDEGKNQEHVGLLWLQIRRESAKPAEGETDDEVRLALFEDELELLLTALPAAIKQARETGVLPSATP